MNYKPRPEFHHENELILATLRRRFVAYLIDTSFLSILYFCISIWFGISGLKITGAFEVEFEMHNTQPGTIIFFKILLGTIPLIYFTSSFYFWKGQTIGKRILRLRVISLYHEHLGLWHSVERSLGYYASALEGGFGFFQAFWNPNRMALHDKIGETIVIKLQKKQAVIKQDTES
jgi:uncharacterized RDD family membrane protein YckC